MIARVLSWIISRKKFKLPAFMIFFVTSKCNSRCRTCFYWQNLNKEDDLSLDEIEKISLSMDKLIWLYISGGEPFLRDDLAKIVEIFYKNNKPISIAIPTNGLLKSKTVSIIRQILDRCKGLNLNITVSLDGLSKTHDYIRGVDGGFNKTIDTVKALADIKRDYPNFSYGITTVVCNKNYSQIMDLGKFVLKELPVDFHNLEIMRGNPMDKDLALPSLDSLKTLNEDFLKLSKQYQDRDKRYYHDNSLASFLSAYLMRKLKSRLDKLNLITLKEKRQVISCMNGEASGVIDHNADVLLCELLPKIGNLRSSGYDFPKVWFSKEADKQRDYIKNKKCHCTHCLFQARNIIFSPRQYLKLLFS